MIRKWRWRSPKLRNDGRVRSTRSRRSSQRPLRPVHHRPEETTTTRSGGDVSLRLGRTIVGGGGFASVRERGNRRAREVPVWAKRSESLRRVHVDSLSDDSENSMEDNTVKLDDREPSELEKWLREFADMLDVLLAERRGEEALDALDKAERVALEAKEGRTLNTTQLLSLQNSITEHRQKLADQLAVAACQSSTRGVELRAASSDLKRLGDGHRAHSLLLNAHYRRLQYNMQTIHPTSTSYGGAYTAALSQQVFSAIAQAVNDSLEVFGDDSAYASELVTWSTKQTEDFSRLVKRHALASSAAAGGLRADAECVQIAIGHCYLLEVRGLSLCSVLLKLFRPSVEQALNANLKRIEESTAALAAADDWVLIQAPYGTRAAGRSSNTAAFVQPRLSSSAHCFNSMVQVKYNSAL
ncbi:hypothetical protein KSP39_PZI002336 [Platanthera zijinensis]|uniref:Exocyst component Exo84 C-terminal domain-containing protein n=1 Tax=Platanthera zijinensis TaxID=2320716 RepID=A0AAP0BZK2_9ASPA